MTTLVKDFIADKIRPVTTTIERPLDIVVQRMVEHDFSQIPVVDSKNRPIGIVTSDSIRKALFNFPMALNEMPTRHAMVRNPYQANHNLDLLDLFDHMPDDGYALIVDDMGVLVGIVTNFDTAEHFRQRGQDIYLVENIEQKLKDYVLLMFGSEPAGEDKLDQAIQSMTNSSVALREKFETALRHYISLADSGRAVHLNDDHVEEVFRSHLDADRPPSQFDDLTLSNYMDLFLYRDYWNRLEEIFELDKLAVKHLLDSVLRTRNDLAHFRDITRMQSAQLRDCYDFLLRHEEAIQKAFVAAEGLSDEESREDTVPGREEAEQTKPEQVVDHDEEGPYPVADEPAPGDSRYAPLAIWLQEQPPDKNLIKPTFSKIEQIIGGRLPDSAYRLRAWWANDSVGHVQSKQWLDVGWRVASVNMTKQVVRFARIKERQKKYIEFFSALISKLNEHKGFKELEALPDGRNWHWVKSVSVWDRSLATFNFSFGRGGIFRVELYIDTGNKKLNKQLFDALHGRREEIESELGAELSWQRLDNRRASRVAWIFNGHITDNEEQLAALRERAVPAMISFSKVLDEKMQPVGREALREYEPTD